MTTPRTMFDKIWHRHAIHVTDDGQTLLYIDRHLLTDGAFHGFNILAASGSTVRRPDQTFAVPDHYVPTRGRADADFADDERRQLVATLDANTRAHGITQFGINDARQGIVHIIGPPFWNIYFDGEGICQLNQARRLILIKKNPVAYQQR